MRRRNSMSSHPWLLGRRRAVVGVTLLAVASAGFGVLATGSAPADPPVAALSFQPALGVPADNVAIVGASPGVGEVWAQGTLGPGTADPAVLLRHTGPAGAWQVVPVAGADGQRLDFTWLASRVTPAGGVLLAGSTGVEPRADADRQRLVTRDPAGAFAIAPAPDDDVLALGEQLYGTSGSAAPLIAALDEGGRAGALIAPVGESNEPSTSLDPGVLHYDGTRWTREPICDDDVTTCEALADPPQPLALAAASPDAGWLLARANGTLRLYQRTTGAAGPRWVPRTPATWLFGASGAPAGATVTPAAAGPRLTATAQGVWVDLRVNVGAASGDATVLISRDGGSSVLGTWCYPDPAAMCGAGARWLGAPLPSGVYASAAWPGAGPGDPGTRIITGLPNGALLRLSGGGDFSYLVGGGPAGSTAAFLSPDDGWLATGRPMLVHATRAPDLPLTTAWPVPFRRPLLAVTGEPGATPGDPAAQALAVGELGQVARYVPGQGWSPEFLYDSGGQRETPRLRGVAWPEPTRAYAVGDRGAMWLWRAETGLWEPDPAKPFNFHANLSAIAFSPNDPTRGFAVGKQGVLLTYDKTWTATPPPAGLEQAHFTSVAFAGAQALATYRMLNPDNPGGREIGGLIANDGSGWRIDDGAAALLGPGAMLGKVAGLPDGGAVAAGPGVVIERDGPSTPWRASVQPLPITQAFAISALAAVRDGAAVRALLSIDTDVDSRTDGQLLQQIDNPPAAPAGSPPVLIAPDPLPLSGFLLRERADGWHDEQHGAYPSPAASGDQPGTPDPVLALLVDPTGTQGWTVGGETGGKLLTTAFSTRLAPYVQTADIERIGPGSSPPQQAQAMITTPAGLATFAIAGGAACAVACSDFANLRVGPDVWLEAAKTRMNQIAGLRALLYTGGRIGSLTGASSDAYDRELAGYARLLGSGGPLPTYAAIAPSDVAAVGGNAARFAGALGGLAPAGAGPPPAPPAGSAAYALDSPGVGGTVRVIVLDSSQTSLPADQLGWLTAQLDAAQVARIPAIVMGNADLQDPTRLQNGPAVAAALVAHGASAYFFESDQRNTRTTLTSGERSIPAFGTGTLGYVAPPLFANEFLGASGFLLASVDAAARNPATNVAPVTVQLIPNVGELALDAADGVLLRRSQVALFNGLARRSRGGPLVRAGGSTYEKSPDPYVPIPETCIGGGCGQFIPPAYSFNSSAPDIGDFVMRDPNSTNPRAVLQGPDGKPIPDPTSGLFCAFNAGTTTVTINAGGLTASQPLTVQPGSVEQPCGTVPLLNPPPARGDETVPGEVPPTAPAPAPFSTAPIGIAPPPPPAPTNRRERQRRTSARRPAPATALPTVPRPPVLFPLRAAVPPPAPAAGRPTPPSGSAQVQAQSPVSQPVAVAEHQREEEQATELVHHMTIYHPDPRPFPVWPLALVPIAAAAATQLRRNASAPRLAHARIDHDQQPGTGRPKSGELPPSRSRLWML